MTFYFLIEIWVSTLLVHNHTEKFWCVFNFWVIQEVLLSSLKIMFCQDPEWSQFFENNFDFLSSWVRLRSWKALYTYTAIKLTQNSSKRHYSLFWSMSLEGSCGLEGFVTQKVQEFTRITFGLLKFLLLCKGATG